MIKALLLTGPVLLCALSPVFLNEYDIPSEPNRIRSPAGEFSARFEYGTGTSEFIPIARFQLFDRSDRSLYVKEDFKHTLFDIADNGRVVGINFDGPVSGRAKLHFYDPEGRETGVAEIKFLSVRQFSRDGSVYGVLDGVNGLRLFNAAGSALYNLGPATGFCLSRDGRSVALVRDQKIVLYRDDAKIGQIPIVIPFIRGLKISADGRRLGFIDRKNLYLYDFQTVEQLGHYREQDPELNFITLDMNDEGVTLAGLDRDPGRGKPGRHERGIVYLLDEQASIRWQETVDYPSWDITLPAVEFTKDNRFQVKTDRAIREYGY
jgi:hypothetical protein